MKTYLLKNGTEFNLAEGSELYPTCKGCPVYDTCKRVSGEVRLPDDIIFNGECNGYVLLQRAHKLSNIPPEYTFKRGKDYELHELSQQMQMALGRAFNNATELVNVGSNILLVSPHRGTGKTLAGTTIMNEYIISNCMYFDYVNPLAMYVKFGQWANELRSQFQLNDPDVSFQVGLKLERMKKVPLLMIDDIGTGRITDYIRDITYDLIDYRKEHNLSTIFTTNITPDRLSHPEMLGETIMSRLMFNTVEYRLHGRDRRKESTMVIE